MTVHFPFQNTYAALPANFFARVAPTPVASPRLIKLNRPLAVQLGLDPGAEKAKVRNTAAPLTLGKVAGRYLDAKRDVLRPSTFGGANRDLNVHFAPLSERPIGAITRAARESRNSRSTGAS